MRRTLQEFRAACAAALALASMTAGAADGDLARALVDDAAFTVHARSYYLERDKPDPATDLGAWALGGWLGYQSGWYANLLRIGLVGYTSQPLWAPDDKDGTLLLKPGQDGYAVLGQAYVALKFGDHVFTGYRQLVNQPEVNPQDNRMTPNTFQGYTLAGKAGGLGYFVGYLDKEKTRNADVFRDMATVAGAVAGGDEAMVLGGITFSPDKTLDLRLSSYYVPNILSSTYADAVWRMPLAGKDELRLAAQYMWQTTVGDDNLTGASFDTYAFGVKADWVVGAATLTGAYTQAGKGQNYKAPYGSWPGYTSMIVEDFNRAGEKAWLIGGAYDFKDAGAPGLSGFVNAVFGNDAIDAATGAPASDKNEYDATLDYRFTGDWPTWAKPLWLRARYARIDEKFGGSTKHTDDFRVILNYEWVFKQ